MSINTTDYAWWQCNYIFLDVISKVNVKYVIRMNILNCDKVLGRQYYSYKEIKPSFETMGSVKWNVSMIFQTGIKPLSGDCSENVT